MGRGSEKNRGEEGENGVKRRNPVGRKGRKAYFGRRMGADNITKERS